MFIWVGKDASSHEKGGGLMLAHVSMINIVTVHIMFNIIIYNDTLSGVREETQRALIPASDSCGSGSTQSSV